MKKGSCIFILISLVGQLACSAEELSLANIIQKIEAGKEIPVTGRISFKECQIDHVKPKGRQVLQILPQNQNQRIDSNENSFRPTMSYYNKDNITEQIITFDNKRKATRFDRVDLNQIKEEGVFVPDNSDTKMCQGKYLLIHNPAMKSLVLDVRKQDDGMGGGYSINHYRYGYADKSWLAFPGAQKIKVENATSEKQESVLRIRSEITEGNHHKVRIVEICPKYDYRCLRLTEYENDMVTREVQYENYQDYGGYFLPDRYTNKRYQDGRISHEIEITLRQAEFGIKAAADLFSVEVAAGTFVMGRYPDAKTLLNSWHTEKAETMTIDSVIQHNAGEEAMRCNDPNEPAAGR